MNILQQTSSLASALFITASMLAAFAAPVRADTPPQGAATRSVAVRFAHLDLSREADVRALYRQLGRAAKKACGSFDPRNRVERADWQRCRQNALADAVQRLGNERVAALHEAAGKDRPSEAPRIAAR